MFDIYNYGAHHEPQMQPNDLKSSFNSTECTYRDHTYDITLPEAPTTSSLPVTLPAFALLQPQNHTLATDLNDPANPTHLMHQYGSLVQGRPSNEMTFPTRADVPHSMSHFGFSTIQPTEQVITRFQTPETLSSVYPSVEISRIVPNSVMSMSNIPVMLPPPNTAHTHSATTIQTSPPILMSELPKTSNIQRASRERAPWTPEEDNLLRMAVQIYGDKTEKWAKIAACVPGRTNKNCRKRWFHSLDPSLRKGSWTDEEDKILREGVTKYPNQWSKIADMLEGRTDDQCAKRWRESLDPSIDRSEWTPNEDKLLMEKYQEYGTQWQKIAQYFEGRPGLHCRNRWRKLRRTLILKKDKEHQPPSSVSLININDGLLPFQGTYGETSPVGSYSSVPSSPSNPHFISILARSSSSTAPHNHHSPNPAESPILTQFRHSMPSTFQKREQDTLGNMTIEPHGSYSPYGCGIASCSAGFSQSSLLFHHVKNSHYHIDVEKPYRCAMPGCSKRYKNINGLQYHLRDARGSSGHSVLALSEEPM